MKTPGDHSYFLSADQGCGELFRIVAISRSLLIGNFTVHKCHHQCDPSFLVQTLHGADFICLASTFDKVIVFIVPAQSLVKYEVDYNKKKSGHHEVYYNHNNTS
ncbi:hypothetical protein Veis_0454 [Verminephrobacter eiseniae EF01-2]|uniref:Uncharacterized protein n=1 Tax=Verminephrobacter eiseniae (strain EF01-2) TaxID=391735 RepID=A1WF32_VEREI|nr:hypothetical protein Veis_0454 [Verminephrobacter eiseniae EF01-2]